MSEPKEWHRNEHGQYEGYDADGKLVASSHPKGRLKKAIEEGTPAPLSKARDTQIQKDKRGFVYSRKMASQIIERFIEGETISSITRYPDMPDRKSIYRWIAKHPEFKAEYEEAKKLRADCFHDKAIAEAEGATDPDDVRLHKLKIDTYKWAAGVGNPNEYNPRPKEENTGNIFIINTGIDRPEKPPIDVEHRKVKDAKS
tara:strand:+ start:8818 stop:9417 length:600 start_codon:yes stop_codon:yes gene_type:complete